ncbi:MAG: RNA polymerase sigma factor [Bryobacteraceae bacterium]
MTCRRSGEPLSLPDLRADSPEVPIAMLNRSERTLAKHSEPVTFLQPGHSGDLDVLFDQYSRLVLAIACRVLGDPNEAEDVVQEVFFYLYRKPEVFDPSKGSLKTWIIQITCCRALDRKLYLARRHFYTDEGIDALQLRGAIDLEQQVDAKRSREHLERAFSELSDLQRRTIEFFYFDGLNLREISALLREPLGTVRHHLYRGLDRLRKNTLLHTLL